MKWFPYRIWVGVMMFWASLSGYLFLGHFQMSILVMVDRSQWNITRLKTNFVQENYGPRYNWTVYVEGRLISTYYYGLVTMSIPGGVFADLIGPFKSIIASNILSAIATALAVPLASDNWLPLFLCRFIVGLCGGVTFPALISLIAKWAPPKEKSVFTACTLGFVLGSLIVPPLSSVIICSMGWQWCFYLTSTSAALFALAWFFLVSDYPVDNWFCPKEEAEFINESLEGTVKKGWAMPPLCRMLSSPPFLVLVLGHFGVTSGMFINVTLLPKFLHEALELPVKKVGTMAAMPNIGRLFAGFIYGAAAGVMMKKYNVHKKYTRKGFVLLSHFIPGLIMSTFLLNFGIEFSPNLALALIILATLCSSAAVVTTTTNPQDLGPNFAGTQMGVIAFFAGSVGFIYPEIVSRLTEEESTLPKWSVLFGILSAVYITTGIIFVLFGSTNVQPWNEKKEEAVQEA